MYIEDFKEVVELLENDLKRYDEYFNKLSDFDVNMAHFVCENECINLYALQSEFLQRKFLGEELFEWLGIYLYERQYGTNDIDYEGVKYDISTLDNFMKFAEYGLGLQKKP